MTKNIQEIPSIIPTIHPTNLAQAPRDPSNLMQFDPTDLMPFGTDKGCATYLDFKKRKQEEFEAKWREERAPVRGMFKYHEVEGGIFRFTFRKYPKDPVQHYTMADGQIYTIPLAVARHLNTNCFYYIHQYAFDRYGRPNQVISKKVRRCNFNSLDFMPSEAEITSTPELYTVKQIEAMGF